jgi:phosphotransferase system HPr-like phosphotransfer protein
MMYRPINGTDRRPEHGNPHRSQYGNPSRARVPAWMANSYRIGSSGTIEATLNTNVQQMPAMDHAEKGKDAHVLTLEVEVANPLGIDQKSAAALVAIASSKAYKGCDVVYHHGTMIGYGRGFTTILDLGAQKGSKIKITVSGNGTTQKCLDALAGHIRTYTGKAPSNPGQD